MGSKILSPIGDICPQSGTRSRWGTSLCGDHVASSVVTSCWLLVLRRRIQYRGWGMGQESCWVVIRSDGQVIPSRRIWCGGRKWEASNPWVVGCSTNSSGMSSSSISIWWPVDGAAVLLGNSAKLSVSWSISCLCLSRPLAFLYVY